MVVHLGVVRVARGGPADGIMFMCMCMLHVHVACCMCRACRILLVFGVYHLPAKRTFLDLLGAARSNVIVRGRVFLFRRARLAAEHAGESRCVGVHGLDCRLQERPHPRGRELCLEDHELPARAAACRYGRLGGATADYSSASSSRSRSCRSHSSSSSSSSCKRPPSVGLHHMPVLCTTYPSPSPTAVAE